MHIKRLIELLINGVRSASDLLRDSAPVRRSLRLHWLPAGLAELRPLELQDNVILTCCLLAGGQTKLMSHHQNERPDEVPPSQNSGKIDFTARILVHAGRI